MAGWLAATVVVLKAPLSVYFLVVLMVSLFLAGCYPCGFESAAYNLSMLLFSVAFMFCYICFLVAHCTLHSPFGPRIISDSDMLFIFMYYSPSLSS